MQIEIFEADGYGLDTDLDVLLLNLKRKYSSDLAIRRVKISDKVEIKKHKDVVQKIAQEGLDVLPVIKLDGKIVNSMKLQDTLYKRLG
jgi:disulfide oxidoreductase YuzD